MGTGTFGRTDTGNKQINTGSSYKDASRFQFTGLEDSDLTTISFYIVTACSVKAAIYSDKAGPLPDALLASGGATAGSANSWVDVPVSYEGLVHDAYYWLCAKTSLASVNIRCQDTVNNYKYRAEAYASAFSNPFGTTDTDPYELCIHADYTEPVVGGVTVKKGSCVPAMTALLTKFSALKQPREPRFQPRTFPKLSPRHF